MPKSNELRQIKERMKMNRADSFKVELAKFVCINWPFLGKLVLTKVVPY